MYWNMHNKQDGKTTGQILSGLALYEPEREALHNSLMPTMAVPTVSEREVIIDF